MALEKVTEFFTRHPNETDKPQTYFQHGKFAISNSSRLLVASVTGIIHGVIPEAFKFYTSTEIIHSFKKLADSGRHKKEFKEILGDKYLLPKYTERTGEKEI